MFSKACEYGIRALTIIAQANEEGRRVSIKEICNTGDIPESFTAKILQDLVRKDILKSQKGPSGGFYLERDYEDITLKDIVIAIDGKEIFVGCGLGFAKCDASQPCPVHRKYELVRNNLIDMCSTSNLRTLVDDLKSREEV